MYGLNQATPNFINTILEHIKTFGDPKILLGEDWNSTKQP